MINNQYTNNIEINTKKHFDTVIDIDNELLDTVRNFYNSLVLSIVITSMLDESDEKNRYNFFITMLFTIFCLCEFEYIGLL